LKALVKGICTQIHVITEGNIYKRSNGHKFAALPLIVFFKSIWFDKRIVHPNMSHHLHKSVSVTVQNTKEDTVFVQSERQQGTN